MKRIVLFLLLLSAPGFSFAGCGAICPPESAPEIKASFTSSGKISTEREAPDVATFDESIAEGASGPSPNSLPSGPRESPGVGVSQEGVVLVNTTPSCETPTAGALTRVQMAGNLGKDHRDEEKGATDGRLAAGRKLAEEVNEAEIKPWTGKMRVKALRNLDQFLDWSLSRDLRTFSLANPPQETVIAVDLPEVAAFEQNYGYFSPTRPIVGKVTDDPIDLELTCCLLKTLDEAPPGAWLEIAIAEVLTKVLAYRDLKVGQEIRIPVEINGTVSVEPFQVDHVFDIWLGMPAFGLVPQKEGLASILLFRGTDASLTSLRGWASLMSDLEITGPGLSTFQRAQDAISLWLKKVRALKKSARVMGFSLGGALAAYTFIYENASLAPQGSVAVCAPGVADKVLEDWQRLGPERKTGFVAYINAGDVIPKVGHLFGTVYRLTPPTPAKPITAHQMLMCSKPRFTKALIIP